MHFLKNYLKNIKVNFLPVLGVVLFIKLGVWYVIPLFKNTPAPPPTPAQIVNLCMKTYKDGGLSGLQSLSRKSYAELGKKPTLQELEKVATIDMFSYQLDKGMADYVGFPQDEYFSINRFEDRIGVYLKSMDLTTEEINKNVRKWEAGVNKEMMRLN